MDPGYRGTRFGAGNPRFGAREAASISAGWDNFMKFHENGAPPPLPAGASTWNNVNVYFVLTFFSHNLYQGMIQTNHHQLNCQTLSLTDIDKRKFVVVLPFLRVMQRLPTFSPDSCGQGVNKYLPPQTFFTPSFKKDLFDKCLKCLLVTPYHQSLYRRLVYVQYRDIYPAHYLVQ